MTNPQDPYWQNPYTYDPLGRTPPTPDYEPPVFTPPPAPPHRPPVNVLATLSLVFAFVFAPVGAILGHAGLAQIRRTGELGRDRARAGLALSYTFIAVAVVGLVAWAIFGAAPSTQTAAPTSTPTSAATPAAAPRPVAPDALATLLPGADALKNITSDQNLQAGQTWDNMGRAGAGGAIDRPECWGSVAPGTPDAYSGADVAGYRATELRDSRSFLKSTQVIQAVVAFRDPPAAQAQLAALLSGWRRCGGLTVTLTPPNGEALPFAVGAPADAPNGVTTLDLAPRGLQIRSARAVAAKANVIVDVLVSCSGTTDGDQPRVAGVGIADYVLGKLPG
ncbi:nuclease PIN [Mycobacterium sp. ACS4054]|uniref:sensor domain-containing protein n=1 Tax=Mycobacterium sp. ACS4054 TaxID=1834119 RepID=UPI000801576D|nr:sensor domain-containing protein [Mycobacterium sp. ACS4054]OBF14305.1 nuclease PIN [Mycobacterium sp. ACS4054]